MKNTDGTARQTAIEEALLFCKDGNNDCEAMEKKLIDMINRFSFTTKEILAFHKRVSEEIQHGPCGFEWGPEITEDVIKNIDWDKLRVRSICSTANKLDIHSPMFEPRSWHEIFTRISKRKRLYLWKAYYPWSDEINPEVYPGKTD